MTEQKRRYRRRNRREGRDPEKFLLSRQRYYEKNKEKIKARSKARYQRNIEQARAYGREKARQWRLENAEHVVAYRKAYYAKHKPEISRRVAQYASKRDYASVFYQKNKERITARRRAYYARNRAKLLERRKSADWYVADLLRTRRHKRSIPKAMISPALLEAQRAYLQVLRNLKERKK